MRCCSIKLSTTLLFFSSSTLHSFLHHSWHPSATPLPLWITCLFFHCPLKLLFISFHSVHSEDDETEPEHEQPCRTKHIFLKSICIYCIWPCRGNIRSPERVQRLSVLACTISAAHVRSGPIGIFTAWPCANQSSSPGMEHEQSAEVDASMTSVSFQGSSWELEFTLAGS